MVVELKTKVDFDNFLKENGDKLVVIDFFAIWCGPCKHIAPKIQKMSEEMIDVAFAKVNVDDNEDTAAACNISAMPTFKLYKNGKEVGELVGADENQLKSLIAEKK